MRLIQIAIGFVAALAASAAHAKEFRSSDVHPLDYPTVQAFVAIGANLGDAQAAVRAAMDAISTIERTVVTARSSLYQSAPVEATGPDYINAVVAVRTGLTAEAFLSELQLLEEQAGRERPFPNAPRTLDLDLLMHGNSVKDKIGRAHV